MLDALKNKPGARPLAALTVAVLVADLFVVGARASTHDKPQAKPSVTPTVRKPTKSPTVRPTATRSTRRPSTRPPVVRRASAGCGTPADFNHDGYADLAIGIPHKDSNGIRDSGAVQILYGAKKGVVPKGAQVFTEGSFGSLATAEREDAFGSALTTGDFNGDRYSDLAVGMPSKDINGQDSGAVIVVMGSRAGLTAKGAQYWTQDSPGMQEDSQGGDGFGYALAAGDVNADEFADLIVGSPKEDVQRPGFLEATGSAGVIQVILGSAKGLIAKANQLLDQNHLGLTNKSDANDLFGWSLASGDFDGDKFCDVAVGVPAEKVNGVDSAGAFNIIRGSAAGLVAKGAQFWSQDSSGILDQAESGDQYGYTLEAGDFNGDGRSDLAIGVFDEDLASKQDAGAVSVLYGSAKGLTASGNHFLTEDSRGWAGGPAKASDQAGLSLAAGDFNGDKRADLVVGVPYKSFTKTSATGTTSLSGAGSATVLFGGRAGLSTSGSQSWSQDSPGVQDQTESDDLFGFALTAADFNSDGRADLAIGVPDEGFDADTNVGGVAVLFGAKAGLTATGNQFLSEGAGGIAGEKQSGDAFGAPVAS